MQSVLESPKENCSELGHMSDPDLRKPEAGCGAAILDDAGRLLLIQRLRQPEAGAWGLPGGKIDFGEPAMQTARREIAEELGIPASTPAARPKDKFIVATPPSRHVWWGKTNAPMTPEHFAAEGRFAGAGRQGQSSTCRTCSAARSPSIA
jgi:8-oxo-dGTP pyrophosphatase MutT (NUDIX family)